MKIVHEPTCEPLDRIPAGGSIPYGAIRPKPLWTALVGQFRVRLRIDEFPAVFFRDGQSFRAFMVVDFGEHWELVFEHGANVRYRPL